MMDDGNDPELETTIARYREELREEADLARGDLDELEDHLRDLTAELRERGLPTGAAIAEAARRLGDPRALAREHARGSAPLSSARRWSAIALLAPFAIYAVPTSLGPMAGDGAVEVTFWALFLGALALQQSWTRASLVGALPLLVGWSIYRGCDGGWSTVMALRLASYVGAFVFLVPWRRRELSLSGLGLTLLAPAQAGTVALGVLFPHDLGGTVAALAVAAMFAGSVGAILRLRWGAVVCGTASLALAAVPLVAQEDFAALVSPGSAAALIVFGAIAGMTAAAIGWQTARSTTRRSYVLAA